MSVIQPDFSSTPIILCFSGHDPSGGAGIQADIEAIHASGAQACTVITALTVQDSHNVDYFKLTDPALVTDQANKILSDFKISAFKIGMTGSASIVEAIAGIIKQHPEIPVILDPVLAAGGGQSLADADEQQQLIEALKQQLIPHCSLITPNIPEALALTGCEHSEIAVDSLLKLGAKAVLLTGGHDHSEHAELRHTLRTAEHTHIFSNPRLEGEFHGSGCTLASATAAAIAHGKALIDAVHHGLALTFQSLQQAQSLGHGQKIPRRNVLSSSSLVRLLKPQNTLTDDRLAGLYAITDEQLIGLYFLPAVEQALQGGARIIQYRNKSPNQNRRRQQAEQLRVLCDQYNALLIINDDVELALAVNADGVHIGRDDAALESARQALGAEKIIGVSCYNDIELARNAASNGADYIAFGAFYSSTIKPEAAVASLELLQQASAELSLPICCIGGITADNATPLIEAGAQMLAVISDVFGQSPEQDGIRQAAERLSQLF